MSLQVGDFFEGSYQLKEELVAGRRWLSVDWSDDQPVPVVIELIPANYDENLHAHPAQVPGLRGFGQSRASGYRYLVWELNQSHESTPLTAHELTPEEKQTVIHLIDTLPVAPGETILSVNAPEYWRLGNGQMLLFYRKQLSVRANVSENEEIRHFWKETLPTTGTFTAPEAPIVDSPAKDTEQVPDGEAKITPKPPKYYVHVVVLIGALLAAAIWYTKQMAGPSDPVEVPASPSLGSFELAMNRGIAEEKRGEFQRAMEYFRIVAQMPYSPDVRAKADSLARIYEERAQAECERFRASNSPNLYHIPNQYYQYAALLSETTPKQCE